MEGTITNEPFLTKPAHRYITGSNAAISNGLTHKWLGHDYPAKLRIIHIINACIVSEENKDNPYLIPFMLLFFS